MAEPPSRAIEPYLYEYLNIVYCIIRIIILEHIVVKCSTNQRTQSLVIAYFLLWLTGH